MLDLDSCPTCWHVESDGVPDEDAIEGCLDIKCACKCHKDFYDYLGLGDSDDDDKDGKPFVRNGIFPYLSLPTEIRDHIYSYAFQQDGSSRVSKFHRGTIHTALLSTCKQVYEEACQLPLTSNRLCFNSCVSILDFIGFYLTAKTRTLCINVEIEMFPMAIHGEYYSQHTMSWPCLHKALKTLAGNWRSSG